MNLLHLCAWPGKNEEAGALLKQQGMGNIGIALLLLMSPQHQTAIQNLLIIPSEEAVFGDLNEHMFELRPE